MSSITRFLPKNHLSYLVGKLVHIRWPRFINNALMAWFARTYQINLAEAELPLESYPSLGDFFVRRLKAGLRPIAESWAVHPADSFVTQAAVITEGQLIQAKGKTYSVSHFTQDSEAMAKWNQGLFITYYLCPTDYHRVHSPVSGTIERVMYIPGALWPVNNWSTENIHELFSINERVLVEIKTNRGLVGVMFVGATNVGQIILSFDSEIRGNQLLSTAVLEKKYTNLKIEKGDELGMFRMGSTVVMLYSKSTVNEAMMKKTFVNQKVRVNEALA